MLANGRRLTFELIESSLNLLNLVLAQMMDIVRLASQLLTSPCQRRVQGRGEAVGQAGHLSGRIRQLEVLVRSEELRVGDRAGHGVRHCGGLWYGFLAVGEGLDAGLEWRDDGVQKSGRTKVHKCHRSGLLSEGDAKVETKQDVEDEWEKVEESRRLCGPFNLRKEQLMNHLVYTIDRYFKLCLKF